MKRIERITASSNGERILLKLADDGGETEVLSVSCESYRALALKKGDISDELYERLVEVSEYEAALIKGARILGYGANSKKQLKAKLGRAGIKRELAESVAERLSRDGYVNESEDALRLAQGLIKKGYGPRRIISSLKSKGYSDDSLDSVHELFSKTDFEENCTRIAKARLKNLKNDRAEVQKAIAKLVNLGYNVGEAKKAIENMLLG